MFTSLHCKQDIPSPPHTPHLSLVRPFTQRMFTSPVGVGVGVAVGDIVGVLEGSVVGVWVGVELGSAVGVFGGVFVAV